MPPPNPDDQRLRLRPTGYTELLGTIPYLLGFHPNPHGDLVVLGLRQRRVVVHARPGIDAPPDGEILVARLLTSQPGVDRAIVIGYGPAVHEPAIAAMHTALSTAGLYVNDVLRVDGQRYFCLLCDD